MATKLSLTKSGLQTQRNELKLYQKLLPSLELKRMQLTAEHNKAKIRLAELERGARELAQEIAAQLPMLADREIVLTGLIRVEAIRTRQENVVGVKLPAISAEDITFSPPRYSFLAKPVWVDHLVIRLKQMAITQIELRVATDRMRELERAVRRITQRVNLFEKILIPNAQKNIQRIRIFLGDAERSAVVRSKLAKAKHRQAQQIEEQDEEGVDEL